MAVRDLIVDPQTLDLSRVVAGLDEIRRYNPHRHEMELLSAICYEDPERHVCAGYKDLTADDFWVRGHMPGVPLMPGVLMCESAAQLCSYYAIKHDLLGSKLVGLGGMEDIRFREVVRPLQRFVIVAELTKLRRGVIVLCRFQGFVGQELAVEGKIKGVPLPHDLYTQAPASS